MSVEDADSRLQPLLCAMELRVALRKTLLLDANESGRVLEILQELLVLVSFLDGYNGHARSLRHVRGVPQTGEMPEQQLRMSAEKMEDATKQAVLQEISAGA